MAPFVPAGPPRMTPRQQHVFDHVLQIGVTRPHAPPGLVEQVRDRLTAELTPVMRRWESSTLWLSKSAVVSVLRCEAGFLADRTSPPTGKSPMAAAGDLAHRAIQLAYTHPGQPVGEYVRAAIPACRRADPAFEDMWAQADMAAQSDVIVQATSRVTALLDSWPAIQPSWEPRFEEPFQAKVAGVTLAARADLVLGRPRTTGQQTMVVVDWKSGALRDHHLVEARFHALVATLSFGVPPFRSLVYSLSSGECADPDIVPGTLTAAADDVVTAVTAVVDLLTSRRAPRLECGQAWCPGCSRAAAA